MTICTQCNGTQVIYKDNQIYKCYCLKAKEIIEYLTPIYSDSLFTQDSKKLKALDAAKNVIMTFADNKISLAQFKQYVKSYLIYKNCKLSHMTLTPTNIIDYYINDHTSKEVALNSQIVFLIMDSDTVNSQYKTYIPSFLRSRDLNKKQTWIFSKRSIESNEFRDFYGFETFEAINDICIAIKKV